jgi:hypothetical protein
MHQSTHQTTHQKSSIVRSATRTLSLCSCRTAAFVLPLLCATLSASAAGGISGVNAGGATAVTVLKAGGSIIEILDSVLPSEAFQPNPFDDCVAAPGGAPKACADVNSFWIDPPGPGFDGFDFGGTLVVAKLAAADFAQSVAQRTFQFAVAGTTVADPLEFELVVAVADSLPGTRTMSITVTNQFGTTIWSSNTAGTTKILGLVDGTYTVSASINATLISGSSPTSGNVEFSLKGRVKDTSCGQAGTGSCTAVRSTPNCDDASCCTWICSGLDPTCCQVAWDETCAQFAIALCAGDDIIAGPVIDPFTGRSVALYGASDAAFSFTRMAELGVEPMAIRSERQWSWFRSALLQPGAGAGIPVVRIGLSDDDVEGDFRWQDGSLPVRTYWMPGEPNNVANEDYVDAQLAGWNDVQGSWLRPTAGSTLNPVCGTGGSPFLASQNPGCSDPVCCVAVCAVDPFCCDQSWDAACVLAANSQCLPQVVLGPIVNPANRHRYWVLSVAAPIVAQRKAAELGGALAVPDSAAEQAWISERFSSLEANLLIGVDDQFTEGTFRTPRGDAVVWTAWGPGEPNNAYQGTGEDIVVMTFQNSPAGLWNDRSVFLPTFALVEANCLGDLNDDTIVDAADLSILLGGWGSPTGDLDGDGTTGGSDLSILLGAWGGCPTM